MRSRLLLALTALAVSVPAAGATAVPDVRVALAGHVPGWATPAARLGDAPNDQLVEIHVLLRWRDATTLKGLARRVSDPDDAAYGKHLTPAQFRARFAPTDTTVTATTTWLRALGLETGTVPANRMWVPARGTVAAMERAFGTELGQYRVEGLSLRAPATPPRIPASLANHVTGVRGLDQSRRLIRPGAFDEAQADPIPGIDEPPTPADTPPPAAVVYAPQCSAYDAAKVDRRYPKAHGAHQPYVTCATTPSQLKAAYRVPKGLDGAGQTIVMTGSHAIKQLPSDINQWSKRRGIPALKQGQLRQYMYPGAFQTPVAEPVLRPTVWAVQAATLFEHIRALAPAANLAYVGSTSSFDIIAATALAVDAKLGTVVVNGWYTLNENVPDPEITAVGQIAQQAATTGISLLFASGDLGDGTYSGNGQPSVVFPAHHPDVTAVGATSLLLGRNGAYKGEVGWGKLTSNLEDGVWEEDVPATYRGSGGGVSQKLAQPDYQKGVVPAALSERNNGTPGRTVPDVAMAGDPETGLLIGYSMTFPDGKVRYAERRLATNTSATASFGAIVALGNQRGNRQLGFVNPLLYKIAKASRDTFNDVTASKKRFVRVRIDYVNGASGQTRAVLKSEEFTSNVPGKGYDTVTGLGTPGPSFWRLLK